MWFSVIQQPTNRPDIYPVSYLRYDDTYTWVLSEIMYNPTEELWRWRYRANGTTTRTAKYYISEYPHPRIYIDGVEAVVSKDSYQKNIQSPIFVTETGLYLWNIGTGCVIGELQETYGTLTNRYNKSGFCFEGTYTESAYGGVGTKTVTVVYDGWECSDEYGVYEHVPGTLPDKYIGWRVLSVSGDFTGDDLTEQNTKINDEFIFLNSGEDYKISYDTGTAKWRLVIDGDDGYWQSSTLEGTYERVFTGTPPDPYPNDATVSITDYVGTTGGDDVKLYNAVYDAGIFQLTYDTPIYLNRRGVLWK